MKAVAVLALFLALAAAPALVAADCKTVGGGCGVRVESWWGSWAGGRLPDGSRAFFRRPHPTSPTLPADPGGRQRQI